MHGASALLGHRSARPSLAWLARAFRPTTPRCFAAFNTWSRNMGGFRAAELYRNPRKPATIGCYSSRILLNCPLPSAYTGQLRFFRSSLPGRALVPFLLADIGEGITECELVQWFVKPGDKVSEFDKICEVQSDKASVEISSRFEGVIKKLHCEIGEMAKVGSPLVDIETEGSVGANAAVQDASTPKASPHVGQSALKGLVPVGTAPSAAAVPAVSTSPPPPLATGSEYTLATPAVRRVARENGIDLKLVKGTGKDGRITKEDVLNFTNTSLPAATPRLQAETSGAAVPASPTKQALSSHQKAMFRQMTKSLTIPHFCYTDEFELDALSAVRSAVNAKLQNEPISALLARHPNLAKAKKISSMPLLIKSLSLALASYPLLNAQLVVENPQDPAGAHLLFRPSHNIGVAMDTPGGLLVPNVKDVQRKSVLEIADELARLQEAGSKGTLSPADISGGTISLSNIGTVGGTVLKPVIVTTELCIVGIGRMRRMPRFETVSLEGGRVEERVVAKQIVNVSWSADHRVVDGATIARFNEHWRSYIEKPALMLSELR